MPIDIDKEQMYVNYMIIVNYYELKIIIMETTRAKVNVFVLMRVYNAFKASANAQFLREGIESFLSQNYENKELILFDDSSSDGTVELLREYAAKYNNIYFTDECCNIKNLGVGRTYVNISKVALSRAKKEDVIYVLDDDDIYVRRDSLSTIVKKMSETDADVCFINLRNIGDANVFAKGKKYENQAAVIAALSELNRAKTIAELSIIAKAHWGGYSRAYRARVYDKHIGLIPELTSEHRVHNDLTHISSLLLRGLRFTALAEPIYGVRRRTGSVSKSYSRTFFTRGLLFLRTAKDMVLDNLESHVDGAEMYLQGTMNVFYADTANRIAKMLKDGVLFDYSEAAFHRDFHEIVFDNFGRDFGNDREAAFRFIRQAAAVAGVAVVL